jgi:hypothetical protein
VKGHQLSKDNSVGLHVNGKTIWMPALPEPLYVATGLPFWKRLNEKYWRPQCNCGRIFDNKEDYHAHLVYMNSAYGLDAQDSK